MNQRCPACGTAFGNEDRCPQCGLPVAPPGASIPPGPQPVSEESVGVAPAPKKPLNRKKVLTAVGIGVTVLALVAGLAFGAVALFAPGGPLGGPIQLKVTGQPMNATGNWAHGVRESWRTQATHGDEQDASGLEPASLTSRGWLFDDLEGDITSSTWAYDPRTGKQLWNTSGMNGKDLVCAQEAIPAGLPCVDGVADSIVLMDAHTGKAKAKLTLAHLGILPKDFYLSKIGVVAGEIIVALSLYANANLPELGDLSGVLVARVPADLSSVRWHTTLSGCEYYAWKGTTWLRDDVEFAHGVVFTSQGVAVDFASGKPILDSKACVSPVSETSVYAESHSGSLPRQITAPDGAGLNVLNQANGLTTTGALPTVALRTFGFTQTGEGEGQSKVGPVSLTAFDPGTGKDIWSKPIQVTGEEATGKLDAGQVAFDGTRLIVSGMDQTMAVNPATGAVLWSVDKGANRLTLGDNGVLLACLGEEGGSMCYLRDADTGKDYVDLNARYPGLWQASLARNESGTQSLMVKNSPISDDASFIARLDPADRPSATLAAPAGTPSCPAGMNPISWTQYVDGAILLCQAGQKFAVVSPTHPDWEATELNFTDGGQQVVYRNGVKIRVTLGGSVVYTDANGTTTSRPATKSWNNAQGEVKFAVPDTIKTCPAGAWPISLSTYKGGWLLVCGTASDQPTVIYLAEGSTVTEVGSVTRRNRGYCGTAPIGQVCAFESPAVVSITKGGTVVQHSASANYFDGSGAGGAGKGTGSYGVNAPSQTAKDQVRYLTQILQKSAAGRANLETAVNKVRTCTDVAGAAATMNGVVANRQELLDALDSTPVDAIPNGAAVVAKLRDALQKSHDSDLLWVKWAQAQLGNGCSDGENNPYFSQVDATLEGVALAKDIFVADWNSRIAPTYGAPTFQTSQI